MSDAPAVLSDKPITLFARTHLVYTLWQAHHNIHFAWMAMNYSIDCIGLMIYKY